MLHFRNRTYLFVAVSLAFIGHAFAGQLTLGTPLIEGNDVSVPVMLGGNGHAGVAAMNFTVSYDPAVLEPRSAVQGAAAIPADRQLHANLAEPGSYVVVMMGLSQQTVTEGEIARLIFQRKDAAAESTSLTVLNTSFAALDGSEVPSSGSNKVLQFSTGPKEEPAPGTPPAEDPPVADPDPQTPPPAENPSETPEPAAPAPPTDGGIPGGSPQTDPPAIPPSRVGPMAGAPAAPASPAANTRKQQLLSTLDQMTAQARQKHEALASNEPGPAPASGVTSEINPMPRQPKGSNQDRVEAVTNVAMAIPLSTDPAHVSTALAANGSAQAPTLTQANLQQMKASEEISGLKWVLIAGGAAALSLIAVALLRRTIFSR